jgi:hypothetical protein
MDDVTSGFNIGSNITTKPDFNEMVGFTEKETGDLISYYHKEKILEEESGNYFLFLCFIL